MNSPALSSFVRKVRGAKSTERRLRDLQTHALFLGASSAGGRRPQPTPARPEEQGRCITNTRWVRTRSFKGFVPNVAFRQDKWTVHQVQDCSMNVGGRRGWVEERVETASLIECDLLHLFQRYCLWYWNWYVINSRWLKMYLVREGARLRSSAFPLLWFMRNRRAVCQLVNLRWGSRRWSARPYESCKILKGRPRRNAFSNLVHRQYKSFPTDRFLSGGNQEHNCVE